MQRTKDISADNITEINISKLARKWAEHGAPQKHRLFRVMLGNLLLILSTSGPVSFLLLQFHFWTDNLWIQLPTSFPSFIASIMIGPGMILVLTNIPLKLKNRPSVFRLILIYFGGLLYSALIVGLLLFALFSPTLHSISGKGAPLAMLPVVLNVLGATLVLGYGASTCRVSIQIRIVEMVFIIAPLNVLLIFIGRFAGTDLGMGLSFLTLLLGPFLLITLQLFLNWLRYEEILSEAAQLEPEIEARKSQIQQEKEQSLAGIVKSKEQERAIDQEYAIDF